MGGVSLGGGGSSASHKPRVEGSGPRAIKLEINLQCPAFGTISIHKRTIPKAGHWGLGDKSQTVVGD